MTPVEIARRYSKASEARLLAMEASLRSLDLRGVDGDVVECGVWRGGHIVLARLTSPLRRCWLYDTFTGMTEPGPHDVRRSGNKPPPEKALSKKWTMASYEEVLGNLMHENVHHQELIKFVIGDVCKTLNDSDCLPDKIALLRLDTDWYESTKKELEVLWPRLVSGGVLIVDDYGHWMGARKAVDEYLCRADRERLTQIDYTAVMLTKE